MPHAGPDLAIGSWCGVIGAAGLVLNGFLLYLAVLRNKTMGKQDFIIFVMNRTMIDLVYSLSLAVFQPIGILAAHTFPNSCSVAGLQDVAFACTSVAAEAILAGNRFVSVCHRSAYNRLFKTPARSLSVCTSVWILGLCSAIPHAVYGSLGRSPGVLCAVRFERDTLIITLISNYILVCVSLALVGYFNFRIFRYVRAYQNQKLCAMAKSRLQRDGEVAKFIFVSASVPLILQTPATLGLFFRMYNKQWVSDWTMFVVSALFVLCPLINPMISALMVQPLRRECRRLLGKADGEITTVSMRAITVKGSART